jgi:membrane protein
MDVFELLVGAQPRSWIRQRAIASLWVVGSLLAIAATTWILLVINDVTLSLGAARLPQLVRRASDFLTRGWKRFGVLLVFVGMAFVGLAIFYRTAVRHPPGVQRKVWTGTAVALISWALVSWAFGSYVSRIAHYAVFYGSLATVAVILLWLYLTSLALVLGAEVNAVLEGMREPIADSMASIPDPDEADSG